VAATAAERKGIQPVVIVKVNGGARVEVHTGTPVTFTAVIEVPPNTGKIVSAAWDFEGDGTFSSIQEIAKSNPAQSRSQVTVKMTHVFSKPGAYFLVLLAISQRDGNASSSLTSILNLAKVRVVVK
jgi:hypothetical protein